MPQLPHGLRGAGALVAGAALALSGCSSESPGQARELARSACSAPAPSLRAGFDVRTATADQMSELASSAASRRATAEQAAAGDDRWQTLADAATAISSFAGVLRDARATGRSVDEAVPREMWDQYKYASDAFILECRDALTADSVRP